MPKLDLTRATRIKGALGEISKLKGPGFSWAKPAPGAGLPVTAGLVLHLEADQGVISSGGVVTEWQDQSPQGNHLTAYNGPTVGVAPTGAPMIVCAGGAYLGRSSGLVAGLPLGQANRSMFFAVRYTADVSSYVGMAYGNDTTGAAFGLISTNTEAAAIQIWSSDVTSAINVLTRGWFVHSVVVDTGRAYAHRADHDDIGTGTLNSNMNTAMSRGLWLARDIRPSATRPLECCAALIYDRAVSGTEATAVVDFLRTKYVTG